MKWLQGSGLGSQKKQAEPLTEENKEKLWQAGVVGTHKPMDASSTKNYDIHEWLVFCSA